MPQRPLPYKNKKDDLRYKVMPEDYPRIIENYYELKSYAKTALRWGISKKRVIQIVRPDIYEKDKRAYKERRLDGRYYKKEKHRLAIRKHRARKRELNLLTSK